MKKFLATAVVILLIGTLTSCATLDNTFDTRKKKGTAGGAAAGAIVGAALGQAIGGDTESTLWGAAIGTVVGGVAGHQIAGYMDRQEEELRKVAADSEAMSIKRSRDVLVATFKSGVFFDFDSSTIKAGGYPELDRVAKVINQYPETVIQVEGHTDSTGSDDYNQELSERRAEAVERALINRDVDPRRVVPIGFGESMPVSSDDAQNRRVNIVIIPVES